ncbi:DNA ligase D [Taibaiella koreensis]|uniref:DNA ligase D n=1 Tax=Taibaiella koreensis TaxID=1268548 RepID=UPI000E59E5FA|nr:DNA ligase D [Taibaiella koreensis]
MTLRAYNQKRSFQKTSEPKGQKHKSSSALHFVIQQHDASHMHYDFRLEMEGVLKSWAVPKGPSLDPEVKRLAMMVEDHPYSYKDFEGIIPEGNYGAGTVIVWDEGTYEPLEEPGSRLKGERLLLRMLKTGSLKFRMQGKKLKGEFALVKTKGMGDNAWLLIKHRDRYASEKDVTLKNKSVQSGKTLAKVEATSQNIWTSSPKKATAGRKPAKKAAAAKKAPEKKVTTKKAATKKAPAKRKGKVSEADVDPAAKADVNALWGQGTKASFPKNLQPMLATLVDEPFDNEQWEFEVKWDGYRALALMNKKTTALRSRNNKSFDEKFYPVYEAIRSWGIHAVVDGEIVVVKDNGLSDFGALQNWRSEADGTLLYYVFDLLWLDGRLLTGLPLDDRKVILQTLMPEEGIIQMGITVKGRGIDFFRSAGALGLEGIIAKRSDSLYLPGERSRDWLKIKAQRRQEVIIAGYTRNDDTPKLFSALLLGIFDGDQLHYAGKVGTGFNDKLQREMMRQFKPLVLKESPFDHLPDYNKPSRFRPDPPHATVTWLEPRLVCEINFTEITEDGVFRHPSFIAMRNDKQAKEVVMEKEANTRKVVKKSAAKRGQSKSIVKAPAKGQRKTLLNPSEENQVRSIEGNELKLTHLSKLYWPDDKLSKRDMLNYYYQMAPYILPYLKNRPLSLNRFPNGIKGKSFYQKDVSKSIPGWARTFPYRTADEDRDKEYLVGGDETGLLYMANLGTIEMNPWNSCIESPEQPDWCALDIDPDKSNTFDQVIEVAQAIHGVLEQLKIEGYCKTSGSTGIHIYIPLGAQYSYDQSQLLARFIATQVQLQLKTFTSIERMTRNRKGKIYIDYLQNRPQATLAAPYSLRPKPGATVSMPLAWHEVKKGLKMKDFTLKNVPRLIKERGDLFKPVLGKGINLKKIDLPE